jgi:hypothetical protein
MATITLIPDEMKENWAKFSESVINSDLDNSTSASINNSITVDGKKFLFELKIKSVE